MCYIFASLDEILNFQRAYSNGRSKKLLKKITLKIFFKRGVYYFFFILIRKFILSIVKKNNLILIKYKTKELRIFMRTKDTFKIIGLFLNKTTNQY